MTRQEIYQEIKQNIRIVDYAAEIGFTVLRKGRYYSLKEHDSVIIDTEKNCFWRNSRAGSGHAIGKGGSVIDFALEFTNLTLHEILKYFSERVSGQEARPKVQSKKHSFSESGKDQAIIQLPEADSHMRNVFAYLTKTRKIAAGCVQRLVDDGQLYQDTRKNCVFVSYDQEDRKKPVFACKRGTNTEKPFYGDVEGCDYSQCFYIDRGADSTFVTESVIDALSVMTLRPEGRYNYLVLAGVGKTGCIRRHLKGIQEICIGTDNDEHGREAAKQLEGIISAERPDIKVRMELPPDPYKDWNDVLQEKEKNR